MTCNFQRSFASFALFVPCPRGALCSPKPFACLWREHSLLWLHAGSRTKLFSAWSGQITSNLCFHLSAWICFYFCFQLQQMKCFFFFLKNCRTCFVTKVGVAWSLFLDSTYSWVSLIMLFNTGVNSIKKYKCILQVGLLFLQIHTNLNPLKVFTSSC